MIWKKGEMLWHYFHLPTIKEPYSDGYVLVDVGDDLLTFSKNGEIIRYYNSLEDRNVFCLSYDFEKSMWMFWLHDDTDLSWIPDDGCEWSFKCSNIVNTDLIQDQNGILEVEK